MVKEVLVLKSRGYKWNAERVENELKERRKRFTSIYNYYRRPFTSCSFGFQISSVLYSCDNPNPEENDKWNDYETTEVLSYLPNMVRFLTEEPGRQYIGSLHPKTPADWENDVYEKE